MPVPVLLWNETMKREDLKQNEHSDGEGGADLDMKQWSYSINI